MQLRFAYSHTGEAAARRGKQIEHGLQTNLLAYTPEWDGLIAEMFGNTVSTSLDYPNLHRKVIGRDPQHYDAVWARKVRVARAAGIDVKMISVLNQGTLEIGAERFYEHLVHELGITDFQINTPFPGGADNAAKQNLYLDLGELSRFHCELADIWLERGNDLDVRIIGPFDQLMNWFMARDGCLPCIWGKNCADELVAIDACGNVAQCDCWVTSYPDYVFGNILESADLSTLLRDSKARRQFSERPLRLMQRDCIECDDLALCHGGCPVRTYSTHQSLFEKDPYCHLYKSLFGHMQRRATECMQAVP